jgi:hypothetical protein
MQTGPPFSDRRVQHGFFPFPKTPAQIARYWNGVKLRSKVVGQHVISLLMTSVYFVLNRSARDLMISSWKYGYLHARELMALHVMPLKTCRASSSSIA